MSADINAVVLSVPQAKKLAQQLANAIKDAERFNCELWLETVNDSEVRVEAVPNV